MRKINDLFNEWEKLVKEEGSDHFVPDGVISEEHWKQANRKILFILKETNNYRYNVAELINTVVTTKEKKPLWQRPTFHNIGRWAYGLLNYPESVNSYDLAHKHRKYSLLSCAFINVKKTTGTSVSKKKEIEASAEKYKYFLKEQIELLQPDVIVFGGTYKVIKTYVLPELSKVSYRIHKYKDIICINANHPACTKKRKELYKQVMDNYHKYMSQI